MPCASTTQVGAGWARGGQGKGGGAEHHELWLRFGHRYSIFTVLIQELLLLLPALRRWPPARAGTVQLSSQLVPAAAPLYSLLLLQMAPSLRCVGMASAAWHASWQTGMASRFAGQHCWRSCTICFTAGQWGGTCISQQPAMCGGMLVCCGTGLWHLAVAQGCATGLRQRAVAVRGGSPRCAGASRQRPPVWIGRPASPLNSCFGAACRRRNTE